MLCAFGLTWRLWADPAGRVVAANPQDTNLFAWFMRYSATAISHGHLPALVTTGMNAPQGINVMWNTSMLLPGVVLTPVTLLAGPQASVTVLLTAGFAGSAASLFLVLRRWGASTPAAAAGGAVYGFSPALLAAAAGHLHVQFAVLPPLIIDALLRIVTGRGNAVRTGVWLGLLVAAQLFIGQELLAITAVAGLVLVAVLAAGRPRAVGERALQTVTGLGCAAVVTALTCGYALWVQFHGPLTEHGSPWNVSRFHTYPYAFVTPSGALLFHTSASAAAAARYPEPLPEYVAYLGWPLLAVLTAAAVRFCRDPKIRPVAVTFVLLELFSLGAVAVTIHGIRYPGSLLPWYWLQRTPLLGDVLPDRFAVVADGMAAALLAFALDRARGLAPGTGRGQSWKRAATAVAVLAVLPLVPLPVQAASAQPVPAGWQAAFTRLRLAPGQPVLVIPDQSLPWRWQAETGQPASIVGGGDLIMPGRSGKATSYVYARLETAHYLDALWQGSRRTRPPSQSQIRSDLAYWRLGAIVAVTGPDSRLGRYLTSEFGAPTAQIGSVLGWRLPGQRPAGGSP